MAPSQLSQLKASLRDHGLIGPQKSKRQKKAASKDAGKKLQRNAALEGIRERFNPFEVKAPARPVKFEVTSSKLSKKIPGRPGVTKGLGEERRRATLLKEIQNRNKVGGILDRRFGENDPTMTPEQRAAERFARQSERNSKKNSMFNLEDDEEEEMTLTHGGQSLSFDEERRRDDFQENNLASSDEESVDYNADDYDGRPLKRVRLSDDEEVDNVKDGADQLPERKKSKAEVMKEVIAKSKFHKYERQKAKEDDDELRAELDKDMSTFYEALRNHKLPPKPLTTPASTNSEPIMNPDRAAMLAGKDPKAAEREYNERMRQMALDARSKPSSRTKTEEEKAAEEAARLQELERQRLKRMQGEAESSDDEPQTTVDGDDESEQDDAEVFGIGQVSVVREQKVLDVEDEDDFILDDNLIASDSEAEMLVGSDSDDESDELVEEDGDDDFINGLVLPESARMEGRGSDSSKSNGNIAYTWPCPQTHKELLTTLKDLNVSDLPTIVQRIRALYHPRLAEGNKERIGKFAIALSKHVFYLADQPDAPNFQVVESLLRHLHSIAKTQPEPIGFAYRARLRKIADERPLNLSNGDLVMLTGISTTFPTSDHFHSVVTPAMLTITRYLGQSSVESYHDLLTGAYCCTLALQYQSLSKRYVPELITYVTNALAVLAPTALPESIYACSDWTVSIRLPNKPLRLRKSALESAGEICFSNLYEVDFDTESTAAKLLHTFVQLLNQGAELWQSKPAFSDMTAAPMVVLEHILSGDCQKSLAKADHKQFSTIYESISDLLKLSIETRKPLTLHNHRPLAIKQSIPKFEEGYNPDRHYDPDRERSELNKLKAEHKRERKGAMRELRKDANFIARESLREKKEKDAAYEKKYKRLVAEIQGEEGHENKAYEREKAKRKGKW